VHTSRTSLSAFVFEEDLTNVWVAGFLTLIPQVHNPPILTKQSPDRR